MRDAGRRSPGAPAIWQMMYASLHFSLGQYHPLTSCWLGFPHEFFFLYKHCNLRVIHCQTQYAVNFSGRRITLVTFLKNIKFVDALSWVHKAQNHAISCHHDIWFCRVRWRIKHHDLSSGLVSLSRTKCPRWSPLAVPSVQLPDVKRRESPLILPLQTLY